MTANGQKKGVSVTFPLDIGKLPPQSIEFEEVILGGLMLEKEAMEEVVDIIKPESFYKDDHQKIFGAALNLYNSGKPIDILTVTQKLRELKELDLVGGPVYLSELTSRVASAAHIEFQARIVQQNFIKRELIRVSSEIQNRAFDESIDVSELIDFSQIEIEKATSGNIKKLGLKIGQIGKKRIDELEEISKKEIKFTGVKSWDKVVKFTGGWQPKNLIILAARPGMGKTRIAQEISVLAAKNNQPVVFFSLEMADTEIFDRQLSADTGIENMYIRQADFNENDWQKINKAQGEIDKLEIIIDDTPALTVSEFKSKARYYKKKYDVQLIIVDYLQLMKSPDYRKFREQEISDISGTLKSIAKELDLPVIALSQLSRDVEKRNDKTPVLSDLRESGAIEQDADVVIFIHRPEEYEKNDPNPEHKNLIQLIFAKQRHGSTGVINLWKSSKWSTIYEFKNDYEQDVVNDLAF